MPWFHSWYSPINKIIIKMIEVIVQINKLENLIIIIIGKINAISTSKIRKIIVIKKNRKENGSREDDFGSNPHSNGDLFSRSTRVFFLKIEAKIITIKLMIIITIEIKIIERIIYTIINRPYDWKSNILFYTI